MFQCSNNHHEGNLTSAESDDISLVSFFSDEDVLLAQDRTTLSGNGAGSQIATTRKVLSEMSGPSVLKRSRKRKAKPCSVEKNVSLTLQSLGNHHLLQSALFLSKPHPKAARGILKRQKSCEGEENQEPNLPQNTTFQTEGEPVEDLQSLEADKSPPEKAVSPLSPGKHYPLTALNALTTPQLTAHFGLTLDTCVYVQGLIDTQTQGMYRLWRQVSIELGIPFDVLLLLCKRGVFYVPTNTTAYPTQHATQQTTNKHVFTKHDDMVIYGKVLAWVGSGRGLWEGLSARLNTTMQDVMNRWCDIVSDSDQARWCRLAYSARLHRVCASLVSSGDIIYSMNTTFKGTTGSVYDRIHTAAENVWMANTLNSLYPYANRYILMFIHNRVMQYNHTVHSGSESVFWQFLSNEVGVCAFALEQLWQHMCLLCPDSSVFVPLVCDVNIRHFTPVEDRYVIILVKCMYFRYGSVRWRDASSYDYVRKCPYDIMYRWLYYLRFNVFLLYKHCYDVLYRLHNRYRVVYKSTHFVEVRECVVCMLGAVELRYVR